MRRLTRPKCGCIFRIGRRFFCDALQKRGGGKTHPVLAHVSSSGEQWVPNPRGFCPQAPGISRFGPMAWMVVRARLSSTIGHARTFATRSVPLESVTSVQRGEQPRSSSSMLLVQSVKCQRSGDGVPGRWALLHPKVRKNRMSRKNVRTRQPGSASAAQNRSQCSQPITSRPGIS